MADPAIAGAVEAVSVLVRERLDRFPGHPLFLFARQEVDRIGRALSTGGVDRSFYDGLRIGLMCARELEASDPLSCAQVYAMLEAIRRSV